MKQAVRILLVDDSPHFLDAARDFLQVQEGLVVAGVAINADDAIAQTQKLEVDLILLDLNLAHHSGLDLIPIFKVNLPKTRIIVLTIMDETSYRAAALQAGADDFVPKNEMGKRLVSAIDRLMARPKAGQTDEQKSAPEALYQHNTHLAGIINSTTDALIMIDEEHRILLFNPAAEQVFRCKASEAVGSTLDRFIPSPARAKHREYVRKFGNSGKTRRTMHTPTLELNCLRADGETFISEISISQFEINGSKRFIASIRDITDRKREEEHVLFQSMLVDNMRGAIVSTDANFKILNWNKAAERIFGFQADEVIGRSSQEVLISEFIGITREEAIKQLMETGKWEGEVIITGKDGTRVHTSTSTVVIKNAGGKTIGILAISRDITEQKIVERKWMESEAHYRDLVENIRDLICTHDLDGQILSVNRAVTEMLGYDSADLIGRNLREVLAPDVRHLFNVYLARIQRNGTASGLMKVQTRSGEIREWDYHNTLRTDGVASPIVRGFARDVTEQRLAEQKLRESEERFRNIYESMAIGMYRTTPDGRILMCNPALAKMLGYDRVEEVLARNLEEGPYEPICLRSAFKEEIEREGFINGRESMWIRRDGAAIYVRESSRVVRDAKGKVQYYEGTIENITERKRAEEEIRHLKEFHETLINSMTEGIIVQNAEGYFSYVNPAAAAITGYPPEELVGVHWKNFFPPEQHQIIEKADALRAEGKSSRYEIDFLHKKGHRVNMLVSGNPLFENGNLNGSMAVFSDITERKQAENEVMRLYTESQRRLKQVEALRSIDVAISASMDLRTILNIVLGHVESLLNVDAADILLFNPNLQEFRFYAGRGFHTSDVEHANIRLGASIAGQIALERKPIVIAGELSAHVNREFSTMYAREGFVSYVGVPLIAKGHIQGVLEVYHRSPHKPEPEWLDVLETLAGQAAIAVDNSQLFVELQQSNVQLALAYDATIEGWSRAMDLRDKETEGHTQRVTTLTLKLARAMNFSESQLTHIRRGALLHDIGKMGVPDHILLKPDQLTDEEWEMMRKHPQFAYDMLSSIPYLRLSLDIPYCHHEKWDGSGYPRGLKGEEIPLSARLFAVVDVWDAVTSDRPYRPAWTEAQARQYIQDQAGRHFDPEVVKIFLQLNRDD